MEIHGVPATLFYAEAAEHPTFEDPPELRRYLRENIGLPLQQEGLANDASFFINRVRREAGLGVSDKIVLHLNCGLELGWAILFNYEKLARNTRTAELRLNEPIIPGYITAHCGPAEFQLPLIIAVRKWTPS